MPREALHCSHFIHTTVILWEVIVGLHFVQDYDYDYDYDLNTG